MEIMNVLEDQELGLIYGLMGNVNLTTNMENIAIINNYKCSGTVREYLNSAKALSSLKIVMLNETYLDKQLNELSDADIKNINLAKSFLEKKDILVLDFFDIGLNYKEKEEFKRLFKKLSEDLNKTIILYTTNIEFLWNVAKKILYIDESKNIKVYEKEEFDKLSDNVNVPEIRKFIKLMKEKNIEVENYRDVKDLLKAIYRIKETKL